MSVLALGTFAHRNSDGTLVVDQQGVLSTRTLVAPATGAKLAGFTPDHQYLLGFASSTVYRWSADLTAQDSAAPFGASTIARADVHPVTGELWATSFSWTEIKVVDPVTWEVKASPPISVLAQASFAFNADGSLLAVDTAGYNLRVYDTTTWTLLATFVKGTANKYTFPHFSADGSTLWYITSSGVYKADTTTWSSVLFKPFNNLGPYRLSANPVGTLLLAFDKFETLYTYDAPSTWNTSTGALVASRDTESPEAIFTGLDNDVVVGYDAVGPDYNGYVMNGATGVIQRRIAGYANGNNLLVAAPPYVGPAPVTPPFWTNRIKTTEVI